MTDSFALKNLPAPLQTLIRPMLFISLGLHGLLLFIPMSAEKNPISATKEETVKITQIPDSASQPSPQSSPRKPSSQQAQQTARRPAPANQARTIAPSRSQTTRASQSQTTSRAVAPAPAASDSQPAESNSQSQPTNEPFADFPRYPGAQPGCFGKSFCLQTADGIDAVAAYFQKQLPAKKYQIQTADPNEADIKIFQVSKGDKVQYLNLFTNTEASSTVYVLTPDPLSSIEDIAKGVAVPSELYSEVLVGLSENEARDTDFEEPTPFYEKLSSESDSSISIGDPGAGSGVVSDIIGQLRSEIDSTPKLVQGQRPDQVYDSLLPKLKSSGFTTSEVKAYGGGSLYEMRKGSAATYLNLVPTKDRKGTIVVVWRSSPN